MAELIVTSCMACAVGLHEECWDPVPLDDDSELSQCCCRVAPDERLNFGDPLPVGRPVAGIEEITDVLSTGRKRAAMVAVIFPGMLCDWAGLRFAGGGPHPIVGCAGNRIADVKRNADLPENADERGERHHGPRKSTLDNSVGVNLHRVCASCHQHWHTMNDKYYDDRPQEPGDPFEPNVPYFMHDPYKKATSVELDQSEQWWATRTEQRDKYPFPPPSDRPPVVPQPRGAKPPPAGVE